jgi:hypothetical protein
VVSLLIPIIGLGKKGIMATARDWVSVIDRFVEAPMIIRGDGESYA